MAPKMRPWTLLPNRTPGANTPPWGLLPDQTPGDPAQLPGADDGEVQPNPLAMGGGLGARVKGMADAMEGLKMPSAKAEHDNSQSYKTTTNRTLMRRQDDVRAGNMMKYGAYPEIVGTDVDGNPIYNFDHVNQDENDPVYQTLQGLKDQKALLAGQSQLNQGRSTVDLRPLAKLADAWSKQNPHLSDNLEAPENPNNKMMGAIDELQRRHGDLGKLLAQTNPLLNGGSALVGLTQALADKDSASMGGIAGLRPGLAQQNQLFHEIDKQSTTFRQQDAVFTNVARLLGQYNPSADPEIRAELARTIEGTVRTHAGVISMSGGDPSAVMQLLGIVDRIRDGTMPIEQRGQYKAEIEALRQTHLESAKAMEASLLEQNRNLLMPLPEDSIHKMLAGATPGAATQTRELRKVPNAKKVGQGAPGAKGPPTQAATVTGAAPSTGAGPADLDALDAEIARRKAGK